MNLWSTKPVNLSNMVRYLHANIKDAVFNLIMTILSIEQRNAVTIWLSCVVSLKNKELTVTGSSCGSEIKL